MSPSKNHVLLIDDNRDFCEDLAALLHGEFQVDHAQSAAMAQAALSRKRPDVILLDIDLGGGDGGSGGDNGMELLVEIRQLKDAPPIIMMTGDRRIATAVRSIRLGAFDYLTKPPDHNEVSRVLHRALADQAVQLRLESLERDLAHLHGEIVTDDPAMLRVLDQVDKTAPTDASVIVTGESGTGKELIARRLHQLSPRKDGPFVALNCAAVPGELIESELFGHEKGSFTGATSLKQGAFEQARGGTLLLDELGDSPPALQAKLLRALEELSFRRVGGSVAIQADVRIVAATSFDIEQMIRDGELRKELYYRLNVVRLHLPPLRERRGDILHLARHFLDLITKRMGKRILGFSPAAEMLLLAREWPGNIRELRNAVERGVILCEGEELDAPSLAGHAVYPGASAGTYDDAKALVVLEFKREYLSARLVETQGNVTLAAELSGLSRQSFGRMCTEAGVDPREFLPRSTTR